MAGQVDQDINAVELNAGGDLPVVEVGHLHECITG